MRRPARTILALASLSGPLALISASDAGSARAATYHVSASEFEDSLQGRLAIAEPGDVIVLPEGRFSLSRPVTLAVSRVEVRGQGRDRTRLSFEKQKVGGQSWLVLANEARIKDFALVDPPADGLVIRGSTDLVVERVSVEWTRSRSAENGGYGIYPIDSYQVRIEDCYVRGAQEAGIYVGQSFDSVVKNNFVEGNVVGLDIENSSRIRVEGNRVAGNSIGILVSARPKLLQPRSSEVEVVGNDIRKNNLETFAAEGSYLATLGDGKGVVVIATTASRVESNRFESHDRTHLLLLNHSSLALPELFDPFFSDDLDRVRVSGNEFARGALSRRKSAPRWQDVRGFDVVWDGVISSKPFRPETKPTPICRGDSPMIDFLELSAGERSSDYQKRVPACVSGDG